LITVFDNAQRAHDPRFFLPSGAQQPCPEKPARVDAPLGAVQAMGGPVGQAPDAGLALILAVHPSRCVTFLQTIHTRWLRIPGASAEVIPTIRPANRTDGYPLPVVGQAGYHQTDTSCPIWACTWNAADASAQTAIHGADLVLGKERAVYALARPPGHRSFAEMAGACHLDSSAIAARRLTDAGRLVAMLDVDPHHGNGTQGIFHDRGDVLTVAIRAHLERYIDGCHSVAEVSEPADEPVVGKHDLPGTDNAPCGLQFPPAQAGTGQAQNGCLPVQGHGVGQGRGSGLPVAAGRRLADTGQIDSSRPRPGRGWAPGPEPDVSGR
jgi:acetoin utilization deacetylase AcuC-like enzyme